MKSKLLNLTLAVTLSTTTLAGSFIMSPVKTYAKTGIGIYSIPVEEDTFTLIDQQRKTFDNTYTYAGIYGAIGGIIGSFLPGGAGAVGAATGIAATWVNNKLGVQQIVYTQVRLGLNFNDSLNYYEYVQSVVQFSSSNFSSPTDVTFVRTGEKVSDSILANYGLKNP